MRGWIALVLIGIAATAFALGRWTGTPDPVALAPTPARSEAPTSRASSPSGPSRSPVAVADDDGADAGEPSERRDEIANVAAALARCQGELARHAADGEAIGRRPDGPWFPIDREELLEMARRCEVREESPMPLEEVHVALLGITPDEREAYRAAFQAMVATRTREQIAAFEAHDGGGSWHEMDDESFGIDAMREQMERAQNLPRSKSLLRDLAEERAGLRAPTPVEQLVPGDRWHRSQLDGGEVMERELGARLGAARARELRARLDGWPGQRFKLAKCPP